MTKEVRAGMLQTYNEYNKDISSQMTRASLMGQRVSGDQVTRHYLQAGEGGVMMIVDRMGYKTIIEHQMLRGWRHGIRWYNMML